MTSYKDHLTGAMEMLASNPYTRLVGYNASCGGTANCFPPDRRPEMPLAEALCAGVATGLALSGFIPILWLERQDFIWHAFDQIANHMDMLERLSDGIHKPGVIIRVCTGNRTTPLLTGPTHCRDASPAIRSILSIPVINLKWTSSIIPEYRKALERALNGRSTMLVEDKDLYFTT